MSGDQQGVRRTVTDSEINGATGALLRRAVLNEQQAILERMKDDPLGHEDQKHSTEMVLLANGLAIIMQQVRPK